MILSKTSGTLLLSAISVLGLVFISGCTNTHHETSVAQYVKSSAITFKVKENLVRDRDVNSARIAVNTYRDTVTLSGFVKDSFQEDKAIEVAENVKGVKYVVDNLVVTNA
ncbi:MAG TPA: BON domain-containing protein [Gammaproteobacteria bacterium]|nr:BON domain-containing protein [Gammaproteobacteria bacterium]